MITKEKIIDNIVSSQEMDYLAAIWNDNHSRRITILDLIEDLREILNDGFTKIKLTTEYYAHICGSYFEVKMYCINPDEIEFNTYGYDVSVRFKGLDTTNFYEVSI